MFDHAQRYKLVGPTLKSKGGKTGSNQPQNQFRKLRNGEHHCPGETRAGVRDFDRCRTSGNGSDQTDATDSGLGRIARRIGETLIESVGRRHAVHRDLLRLSSSLGGSRRRDRKGSYSPNQEGILGRIDVASSIEQITNMVPQNVVMTATFQAISAFSSTAEKVFVGNGANADKAGRERCGRGDNLDFFGAGLTANLVGGHNEIPLARDVCSLEHPSLTQR